MKQILITIFFLIIAVAAVKANDGVFYASGGTLVPLQETRIELRKELLEFFIVDYGYARVEVNFEFFNPGNARTLTVGFVTPPAEGDVTEDEARNPFISDFTVNVNGRDVPFKIAKLSSTTFKKGNQNVSGRDFVYYFKTTFKRGMNKIRHTYRFRGGVSVELQRVFDYQITTGKRWANKRIDDFELRIHPDNGIFAIIDSFRSDNVPASWEIVGDGVIAKQNRNWFSDDGPKVRMFHLNNGYIRLREKNFKPDNDLFFGEYNWPAGWTGVWCAPEPKCGEDESIERISRYFDLDPWPKPEPEHLMELTARERKYVRNYFYAVRGLAFRDPDLTRFYGQFFWYKPIENLRAEDVVLSNAETRFLKQLADFESRLPK